jgi:hypothetical protein
MEPVVTPFFADAPPFTLESRRHDVGRRAEDSVAVLRAGLVPQLARIMMTRLVQTLFFQRGQLLQAQEHGTLRVEELEQRFARIQEQMQTRIGQYEMRIHQLEVQLAACEAVSLELIRKNVLLARRAFEAQQRDLRDAELLLRA